MVRFPKLHIKPFEQFEGSGTLSNFIEPLLHKKRTEQSWKGPKETNLECQKGGTKSNQTYMPLECTYEQTMVQKVKHALCAKLNNACRR